MSEGFLDKVKAHIKQGVPAEGVSLKETEEERQTREWDESGAFGTPVHEGIAGGYFRGFDVAGKADPTAEELLEQSTFHRERQQQIAMRQKGRGFPTVDWPGPQGLVFTDGAPKQVDAGLTVTPEQMGFAFDPSRPTPWRPGVSPVTGLPDPIEEAKFSDGKGNVTIGDALRIQPKVITDEHSMAWNRAYSSAVELLPSEDRDRILGHDGPVDVTDKWYRDLIKKNAKLLTGQQIKVLEFGRSTTPSESRDILAQMAFGKRPGGESRIIKPGTVTTRHTLTFPGEKISDAYYTTGKKTPADYGEGYFYAPLGGIGSGAGVPGISSLPEGGVHSGRPITRGQLTLPVLPAWAHEDQARPFYFDPRYTGRLVGEAAWDENIAWRMLQAGPMLWNVIQKHIAYIPSLDDRPAGERLVNVEGISPEMAPAIHAVPFPSLLDLGSRITWGAGEVIENIVSPETASLRIANWLDAVIRLPEDKESGLPKQFWLYDTLDHFGPNFWELGHGLSFGLYGAAQKYVNPLSRENIWSSNKSLEQGMDEFTEGSSFLTQGMLNSAYRTIPGVDFERMIRYKPVEAALNVMMVRQPFAKKVTARAEMHMAGAEVAAEQAVKSMLRSNLFYTNKRRAAGKIDFTGKKIRVPRQAMRHVWDADKKAWVTEQPAMPLGRYVEQFRKDARVAAEASDIALAESRHWAKVADGITVMTAPMNVFSPVELLGVATRRLFSGAGQGFLRNIYQAPLSNLASRKALALVQAIERESLSHNRKSTMYVQELAEAIDSITPEMTIGKFREKQYVNPLDLSEPGVPLAAQVLEKAGFTGQTTPITPTVPKSFRTTFNEMAWMEHRPLFYNNPALDLVKVTEHGVWELTDVGKAKLKLGVNPKTGKPWSPSEVGAEVLQLRNEVAGKVAAMNIWGVDLARKSLQLSNDLTNMNLFYNPKQIRQFFWAQLFDPPARKAATAEDIAVSQRAGESRSVATGAAGSLLDNQLRRAGIPIEARLVPVGEAIPKKMIDNHKAFMEETLAEANAARDASVAAVERLISVVPKGAAKSLSSLADGEALSRIDGQFLRKLAASEKVLGSMLAKAEEMGVSVNMMQQYKYLKDTYKSIRDSANTARSKYKQADKIRNGVKAMEERNVRDPASGNVMGGYGMTNDFFRTATSGIGRMSNMVAMHKIFRAAAKSPTIAKSYNPKSKGWLEMPNESLYADRYSGMSLKQLTAEAEGLRVPAHEMKRALGRKSSRAQESGMRELVDLYSPKKYGDLAGKWVQEDVWYHIVNGQKFLDDMKGWYPQMLSKWKSAHTAWSPTTTLRNVITNIMYFGPMAGLSILNPRNWKYYRQAIRDAFSNKKSKHWKETYEDGVFQSSFMEGELGLRGSDFVPMKAVWKTPADGFKEFFGLVDRMHHGHGPKGWIKKRWHGGLDISKFPGIFYSKVCDDIFRQAYHHKYKNRIGRGKAASGAMEKFIDYKNVPGFVNVMRMPYAPYKTMTKAGPVAATGARFAHFIAGQPFMTFTARAMPLTAEWLMRNPVQAQIYMTLHDAMTGESFANAGISEEGAESLYGMVAGMNKWERFRFAPAASMSILSFLERKKKEVPAAIGDMSRPESRDYETRHLFVDTNFLNPFSYATPGFDPIEGMKPIEYLRRMGFIDHFYFAPVYKAWTKAGTKRLNGQALSTFYNEIIKNYMPPVFPSATDLATVFGGSSYTEMVKRTGETTEEWNRYKGGRFWEKAAGAWHGWVDRDEYARPLVEKLFELAIGRVRGYTKTDLIVNRANHFVWQMQKITSDLSEKHRTVEEDKKIAYKEFPTDEALTSAAKILVEGKGQSKTNDLVHTYAVPAAQALQRVIWHMPHSTAKQDIMSRILDFLKDPHISTLKPLNKVVRDWSSEQREIINARRIFRESGLPLTEEQKILRGE